MDTNKDWIKDLVFICAAKGLRKVVISPGSRSAPLVIAFSRHPDIECIPIIDERAAAFFALGMAQQLNQVVGLVCTSGSAALNFYPAIAEAYYQKIPLLVLTTDRPVEMIDQQDGQTIRQKDVFKNHILKSFELPVAIENTDDHWFSNRVISEALNTAIYPVPGPVHVNIPFREPLYEMKEYPNYKTPKVIDVVSPSLGLSEEDKKLLASKWNSFNKKMIIAGLITNRDEQLFHEIESAASDSSVVILTESTSNSGSTKTINCIDPALEAMSESEKENYSPDLLITFGGEIVSKKIKAYLRKYQPKEHWLVDPAGQHIDTFKSLTKIISTTPLEFLSSINKQKKNVESSYHTLWNGLKQNAQKKKEKAFQSIPFCDLSVFKELIDSIPEKSNLHFGNSSPVRYSNLFEILFEKNILVNCNRGTSGIDGCTSTAAGAAHVNGKLTTIITGDLAFFYDSNALWNKYLPSNLRIIIVNNSGGNIFRIIPGPRDLPELEEFFETTHELNAEYLAKTFQIPYYFCDNFDSLKKNLKTFFEPKKKAAILEIKTSNKTSAEVLRAYMNM